MIQKAIIYFLFLTVNILLYIYNLVHKTQWALDVALTVLLLTLIFAMSQRLKITPEGFLLIHVAFLLHNLGSFGFYSREFFSIEYDNIVHVFSSISAAYVTFNFIGRKLHVRQGQQLEKSEVDEHKVILIVLVIATVAMLGVVVELIEFSGFLYLGDGDGVFFVGAGDSNRGGDTIEGQYIDTMGDIVVNTLGSFVGVILFYYFRYKHKYWIKYR